MFEIYDLTSILAICSFAFVMVITPGPNNILLLSSGLNYGYKKSIPAILGVMLGFPIMVILVGLGLGVILNKYPYILDIMKIIGIVYLFYIAYYLAVSKVNLEDNNKQNRPFTFIQLVLFQWLNPKAWIMALTTLSIYIQDSYSSINEVFIISFIYMFMGVFSTNSWTLGGVFLQKLLTNEKQVKFFNILMAILIILSVVPIIV